MVTRYIDACGYLGHISNRHGYVCRHGYICERNTMKRKFMSIHHPSQYGVQVGGGFRV